MDQGITLAAAFITIAAAAAAAIRWRLKKK